MADPNSSRREVLQEAAHQPFRDPSTQAAPALSRCAADRFINWGFAVKVHSSTM